MERKRSILSLVILWTTFLRRVSLKWLLPTPGNVVFTLLVVFGLLWAQNAGALELRAVTSPAASTTTIPYQGRLADTGGNPLTGTYAMTFRLYAAASGGAALWTETWTGGTGVRVNGGLFNVMLGSYTPIPQSVVTGNNTLWLGITVGADNEMQPRMQLGSTAYAMQALTVPDASINSEKLVNGSVTASKQTIKVYQLSDASYKQLTGTNTIQLSSFTFNDVPAGDAHITLSLFGSMQGANASGMLALQANGIILDWVATDILSVIYRYDELVTHAVLKDFSGGTLVITLYAVGGSAGTRIDFGAAGEPITVRRNVTVIAGL